MIFYIFRERTVKNRMTDRPIVLVEIRNLENMKLETRTAENSKIMPKELQMSEIYSFLRKNLPSNNRFQTFFFSQIFAKLRGSSNSVCALAVGHVWIYTLRRFKVIILSYTFTYCLSFTKKNEFLPVMRLNFSLFSTRAVFFNYFRSTTYVDFIVNSGLTDTFG